MNRHWVIRTAFQYRLQRLNDLFCRRFRIGPVQPVVPGHRVHQRLCKQRCGVIVVRILRVEISHGVGVGKIERRARCRYIAVVSYGQRVDVVALFLRYVAFKCYGFPDSRVGVATILVSHYDYAVTCHINVRPERQRLAPKAHCAVRIELLGSTERAR